MLLTERKSLNKPIQIAHLFQIFLHEYKGMDKMEKIIKIYLI